MPLVYDPRRGGVVRWEADPLVERARDLGYRMKREPQTDQERRDVETLLMLENMSGSARQRGAAA